MPNSPIGADILRQNKHHTHDPLEVQDELHHLILIGMYCSLMMSPPHRRLPVLLLGLLRSSQSFLQVVAEGHELVDLGHDAVLLG
ncbi:MAG: hypothetical protein KJ630_13315 [Proteobacteria bacterium]|nr:hypothetical protein [Pseudomonadota bacterium]